jgi:nitroimidazol reductase NimA-like FMN-containing flavoprotein (pyridoxamine 5'-phosphate oxidase superfamily)
MTSTDQGPSALPSARGRGDDEDDGTTEEAVMAVIDPRTWMEHLSPATCWQMLASTPVGRVGVLNDSAPEIYPVNFVVDHRSIVFRTDPGSKLSGLLRSPAVCFEVDAIDPATTTGWSVLVKGRAEEVRDPHELGRLADIHLHYWALGLKQHWVRIVADQVTGRRLWAPAPHTDEAEPGPD